MSLQQWVNGDLFSALRDKYNAVVTLLQGGTSGQIPVSNGSGDFTWTANPNQIPSQSGNTGKFLSTNGTNTEWETITIPSPNPVWVQGISANGPGAVPSYGSNAQIIAYMVVPSGTNRDLFLSATICAYYIPSTLPNLYLGFYKNPGSTIVAPAVSLLDEFYFTVQNNGAGLIQTINLIATNCAPGDVIAVAIRNDGVNQSYIKNYSFSIIGNPVA